MDPNSYSSLFPKFPKYNKKHMNRSLCAMIISQPLMQDKGSH